MIVVRPLSPWFLSLLVALPLLAPATVCAQAERVRISHSSRSNTAAPFYVAVSKGFFKEEGLDVELIQANPRLGAMAVINGDVSFTASFVSTFRGILQGFPLKVIMVALKKGTYFLIARPEIKDIQDLKGKKLGVSRLRGADHLVAEELMRSKGFDPAQVQAVGIGDTATRAQALLSGAIQVVALSPPHDLIVQQKGAMKVLAGPPEIGLPASGLITSAQLLKEKPQLVKRTLRPVMKANRFIVENRQETIPIMLKWVKQSPEIAARSFDVELKDILPDGIVSDSEIENLMVRLSDKRRPLDEVRDFTLTRQAYKEIAGR